MQPNTASEGDNTINTKKGFLISFPAKKKNSDEAASGIVMAKTVNDTEKKNAPTPEKNSGSDAGKNGKGKDRPRHDGKNKNGMRNNQHEQKKQ